MKPKFWKLSQGPISGFLTSTIYSGVQVNLVKGSGFLKQIKKNKSDKMPEVISDEHQSRRNLCN